MIKVSHEMPLCLLKDGTERRYNDYFYALVHLFEDHPDYYEYVVQALKEGREIILDNSAYELNGRPFDTENFVGWINRLNEDSDGAAARRLTYIIPDVFDEMEETYELTERFLKNYNPPGRAMAVCQGKTIEELSTIFINYTHTQGLWKIGINFMSKAYLDFFVKAFGYTPLDPWLARSAARKYFLEYLYHTGAKNGGKVIHLLGCAVPGEFRYYTVEHPALSGIIDSLDTSAPVIQGMFSGTTYDIREELALTKMEQKLADHLLDPLSEPQKLRIQHNIELFRIYNGL
jgi:hypothetical protein